MMKTPWRIVGDEVVTCNCAGGCPCQFKELPTHGRCEAFGAVRIRKGHYGPTQLDGLVFALAYWWPGAIHEGYGIRRFAIEEKARTDQRAALLNIASGKEGCTLFELFASVVTTTLDPIYASIILESDKKTRTARLMVPGLGVLRAEPIKNPITGGERRARIQLPAGFGYLDAEVANCREHHAILGGKMFSNRNCYAQFADIDWSNA